MRFIVCVLVLASIVLVQARISSSITRFAGSAAPYVSVSSVRRAHVASYALVQDQTVNVVRAFATAFAKHQLLEDDGPSGDVSEGCAAALQGLAAVFGINSTDNEPAEGGCGDRAGDVWDFTRNDTVPTQADIAGWCDGCAPALKNGLRSVTAACTSDADKEYLGGVLSVFERLIALVIELPCLKSRSGGYCLPEFMQNQKDLNTAQGNLTVATLSGICSECTIAYFRLFKEFRSKFEGAGIEDPDDIGRDGSSGGPPSSGPNSVRARVQNEGPSINPDEARDIPLDLLCFKVDGEFCYPKFIEIEQTPAANETEEIQRVCEPCISQFITSRVRELEVGDDDIAEVKQFARAIPLMCAKTPEGTLCGVFATAIPSGANETYFEAVKTQCNDAYTNNLVCPAPCKTALDLFNASAGCCGRAVFGLIQLDSQTFNATKAIEWAASNCSEPLLDICAPTATGRVVIRLSNIKAEFFQANKAAIKAAVQKDVAKTLGIPEDFVVIEEVAATALRAGARLRLMADDIQLRATIKSFTAEDAAKLENQLTTAQSSGLLATDSLAAAVPDSGRQDPNRPLTGNGAFSFSAGFVASASVGTMVLAATIAVFGAAF